MTNQQDLRARLISRAAEAEMVGGDKLADLLREAAAKLGRVDEPVRYVRRHPKHGYRWDDTHETPFPDYTHTGWSSIPLYTRPQLPAGVPDDFYLKILVAAGHITQEVADQARDIAQSVLAAAPQPDSKDTQP